VEVEVDTSCALGVKFEAARIHAIRIRGQRLTSDSPGYIL